MDENTNLKKLLEFERTQNQILKQKFQNIRKLQVKMGDTAFKKLYEAVHLEVTPKLHDFEARLDALTAIYANKVDPAKFPLTDAEKIEVEEILTAGHQGFLDSLKVDSLKALERKKLREQQDVKNN